MLRATRACAVVIFRVFSLTLKMTTTQVAETSVTVNNNSPIQDYVHPDNQTQPFFENDLKFQNSITLVQVNKHLPKIFTFHLFGTCSLEKLLSWQQLP